MRVGLYLCRNAAISFCSLWITSGVHFYQGSRECAGSETPSHVDIPFLVPQQIFGMWDCSLAISLSIPYPACREFLPRSDATTSLLTAFESSVRTRLRNRQPMQLMSAGILHCPFARSAAWILRNICGVENGWLADAVQTSS